mgnify:FL=1|tara:strand:+ start:27 stop:404 length:378 start_codon:yes stop_codon:yes gene_type:complete
MKPIIPLYAIGVYTILQSIVIFFAVDIIVPQIFNTTPEGIEIAILMHYGMAPAFLMIGLVALFSTKFDISSQKQVLLAFIIGYIPLFVVFNYFMGLEVMNAGIETLALDIICFILALVAYFKPKE